MNYLMIGVDGRQYGPINEDTLRVWISQQRATGQTLVQPEGSTDWKPLSQLAEFSSSVAASAVPPIVHSLDTRKSKLIAGLLGVILGGLGIHRFYLGYIGIGIAQIIVTFVTFGLGALWGFIEGILILVGNTIVTDFEGQPLKEP